MRGSFCFRRVGLSIKVKKWSDELTTSYTINEGIQLYTKGGAKTFRSERAVDMVINEFTQLFEIRRDEVASGESEPVSLAAEEKSDEDQKGKDAYAEN
jgi:predicted nucleic acid-binding protein